MTTQRFTHDSDDMNQLVFYFVIKFRNEHAAAAADAVFVFKEQKTGLLLKITEKPIRRGKWLSKSTSLTSRT